MFPWPPWCEVQNSTTPGSQISGIWRELMHLLYAPSPPAAWILSSHPWWDVFILVLVEMLGDGIRKSLRSLLGGEFLGVISDPWNQECLGLGPRNILLSRPQVALVGSQVWRSHCSDGEWPACLTNWSCLSFPPWAISFLYPLSLGSSAYSLDCTDLHLLVAFTCWAPFYILGYTEKV